MPGPVPTRAQRATLDREGRGPACRRRRRARRSARSSAAGVCGAIGIEVGRRPLELAQPIVDAAVQVQNLDMGFDERDGRQEALPLQPVLVQVLRRQVRGGDQGHAAAEQSLEQTGENHRIGDVRDEEFVEA